MLQSVVTSWICLFLPACTACLGRQLMNNLHRPPDNYLFVCLIVLSVYLLHRSIYRPINLSVTLTTKDLDPSSLRSSTAKTADRQTAGPPADSDARPRQQPVRVLRIHTKRPSSASSFPGASLPRRTIIIPFGSRSRSFRPQSVFLFTSTTLDPHPSLPHIIVHCYSPLLCFLQYPPSL
jgi:hypothetical protein